MIVILKRYDLPDEHCHQTVQDLQLDHFQLSPKLTKEADLIVFVEGADIKFLNIPGIQSKDSFDVFMRYITSTAPTEPIRPKRFPRRKKIE